MKFPTLGEWIIPPNLDYVGRVLCYHEKTERPVEKLFDGWCNFQPIPSVPRQLKKPSASATTQIVHEEDGRTVFEWPQELPLVFVKLLDPGETFRVETRVRPVCNETFPYHHDEMTWDRHGRTGVVFGLQDARRYYFAGFFGGTKLMIAIREDAGWRSINERPWAVDPRHYYDLALTRNGSRIELSLDGGLVLATYDDKWTNGFAGVYTNTVTRWESARISAPFKPRPSAAAPGSFRETSKFTLPGQNPGLLCGTPEGGLVFKTTTETGGQLLLVQPDGTRLWEHPTPTSDLLASSVDLDRDGIPEIVVTNGKTIQVLKSDDGSVTAEIPYPEGSPFLRPQGAPAKLSGPYPFCYATGGPEAPVRLYFYEYTGAGGHTIWSYDHQLKLRWVHHNSAAKYGHRLTSCDVDNDGREELVAGYYALDDDGKEVWRIRDSSLITKQEHTDNLYAGPLGPEGLPTMVAACGESGALFLNLGDGQIRIQRRTLGHMQRLAVGRFHPERSGNHVWMWTDWGSPGIFFLFSEHGEILHRFQPDPDCATAEVIRWRQGSPDYLFLNGGTRALGLWDYQGHCVLNLNAFGKGTLKAVRLNGERDSIVAVHDNECRILQAD